MDAFNKDYRSALAEYISDEGSREHVTMMQGPFPGYRFIAEEVIAEGDKVAFRVRKGEGWEWRPMAPLRRAENERTEHDGYCS